MKWLHEHPYQAGALVLVGGTVLYMLLRGGSGGASVGGAAPIQLAQINAASSLQQSQIAAQEQVAQAQANVQTNQLKAQLAANEQNVIGAVIGNAIGGEQQLSGEGLQAQVALQALAAQEAVQQQALGIGSEGIAGQLALAQKALGNGDNTAAINELALLTGQGNVASYNQAQAQQTAARWNAGGSIFGSILGGLFGWL